LESYHPYLQPPKVSKNPQTYCVHNTLSKVQKTHFGWLGPLGVKRDNTKGLDVMGGHIIQILQSTNLVDNVGLKDASLV
jgi:hypothetical protein